MAIARGLTSPIRRLPDFVVIGTQRGGTTSLHNWLGQHPDLHPSNGKEVHYFDDNFERPVRWYRSHFSVRRSGLAFESTPSLLYEPDAPGRFQQVLPAAKAVVVLRNPVHRAVSQYHHEYGRGSETRPLLEAIWSTPTSRHNAYLHRGQYVGQLRRWVDTVGWGRLLVLVSEEIYADPQAAVDSVADRIGVSRYPILPTHRNRQSYGSTEVHGLEDYFAPYNAELEEFLGRALPW
ncbi:sulfotransferase [Actinospongicola halichondriae]|uniref:sulfotransferase n=1 Tax=Actinospongicola halichondriae TaxID=3236844 RepID=UPI003D4F8DDD